MSQWLTILGSTGSIGCSTLDVVRRHPDRYRVYALTAARRAEDMLAQIAEFSPRFAVMTDAEAAESVRAGLPSNATTQVLAGADALIDVASAAEVDQVMAAIVGAAGLLPTLAAAEAG
ncbi:MAG: 1-deoxy-D-xylulose-5-phosphate reductoisomerase, partial [Thalassolituus sp.]